MNGLETKIANLTARLEKLKAGSILCADLPAVIARTEAFIRQAKTALAAQAKPSLEADKPK